MSAEIICFPCPKLFEWRGDYEERRAEWIATRGWLGRQPELIDKDHAGRLHKDWQERANEVAAYQKRLRQEMPLFAEPTAPTGTSR